ncbi:hypothetical protein ACFQX6_63985 [Streptosporangium lutulentum]
MATADDEASPAQVLEFAETGARILAAMVRTTPARVRAYHPTGMADPEGFAAMGCVEALLHGQDIAQGLGLPFDPPRDGAHACSSGCSRRPRPTSVPSTHGTRCCGPRAASSCPAVHDCGSGAGTAPHRPGKRHAEPFPERRP